MKKKYKIEVDCASCAQKIEDAVNRLDGVSVRINFVYGKITVEAEEITDELINTILKEGKRVDSDFDILNA